MPTWVSLEPVTTVAATGYLTTPGDPANLSDAIAKITPPVTDAWACIKASESAIIHAIFAALDANGIAPFPGGAYEPVPAAAVNGNFAMFDASRLVVDSGKKAADFAIAAHNHDLVYAPLTHTHAWADITSGLPATWAPSAHNHAFGDITSGLPATWAPSAHVHAITAATANNWNVFYSDGAASVQELALGAQYKVLMSNAANAAPSFELLTNNNLAASGTANIAWNKLAASANKGYAVITDASGYPTTEQYLDETRGGTGRGTWAKGDLVYASNTNELGAITAVTAGRFLVSAGATTAPAYPAAASIAFISSKFGVDCNGNPGATISCGKEYNTLKKFLLLDNATYPTYIAGMGILGGNESREFWPSTYTKRWGQYAIADGTTWTEYMSLTTAGRLQVGTSASGTDNFRVCAYGSDSSANGLGVGAWNIADHDAAYATFTMATGSTGSTGGRFFGSRAALAGYGIVNGVTFGPLAASQDIGFRVGTDVTGSGVGPTVLIDSNKRMKIGQGSTAPATKLHIYDENATTNGVLDVLTIDRGVTGAGVGAANLGLGIPLRLENAAGLMVEAARVNAIWADATNGSENGELSVWVNNNGTSRKLIRTTATGAYHDLICSATAHNDEFSWAFETNGIRRFQCDVSGTNGAAFRIVPRTDAGAWMTPAVFIARANGYVGILNYGPSYPLHVTGDINTTTTYRTNGIAGLSATYNVAGTAGSGTLKTMTFSGGILTAVTTW